MFFLSLSIRRKSFPLYLIPYALCLVFLSSCTKDKGKTGNGYPAEISKILVGKCATAGCHTERSKEGAAGISLETWDALFAGGKSGACCIPYSHEYSTLFLFTNTDPSKGAVNTPTMPLSQYNNPRPPLSQEEMKTLTDWIDAGAPNSEGKIMWSDNPNRKKFYVTNQGCDVVTVFDAATQLQMRYIDVGISPGIESPHMVKISPDGKYWFTSFYNGNVFQKFNTSDDSKAGEVNLSSGSWNTFSISNNSNYCYAADWNPNGKVVKIDLNSMAITGSSPWIGFADSHGTGLNAKGDTLYVTSTTGNFIFKIPVNSPGDFEHISLEPPTPPITSSAFAPHDIAFSPDSLYYYITCPASNEVRVMRVSDDALIAAIPTGGYPLELAFSKTKPYLFVTCEHDLTAPETNRGAVSVINYNTNTEVKRLRLYMSEPHGIAVDDENGLVYVANRNILGGSVPHHSTSCGGTNGFISFIDMETLTVIPNKRIEVAVDPYSIAVR